MEGERRVQIIVAVIAAFLLAFAYGVGYYVGKGAGIEEEKQICEVQKRQLIKTLSRITPVSRPEPVEEKVVGAPGSTKPSVKPVVKKEEEKVEKPQPVPSEKEEKVQEKQPLVEKEKEQEVRPTSEKPEQQKVVSETHVVKKEVEKKVEVSSAAEETKSVEKEKEVQPAEKVSGKRYYLQVGVFRNKANAVKLAQELNRKGFQSKTIFERNYVRVIVGYFDSIRQARVVQKELRSAGFDSVIKWRKN